MGGFDSRIPTRRFQGSEISSITVGANSVVFDLSENRSIALYYYGALENSGDWLYNMPLCGSDSVQSLVGQVIVDIVFDSATYAKIIFSSGRILEIHHDDINFDLVRFGIGDDEYIA